MKKFHLHRQAWSRLSKPVCRPGRLALHSSRFLAIQWVISTNFYLNSKLRDPEKYVIPSNCSSSNLSCNFGSEIIWSMLHKYIRVSERLRISIATRNIGCHQVTSLPASNAYEISAMDFLDLRPCSWKTKVSRLGSLSGYGSISTSANLKLQLCCSLSNPKSSSYKLETTRMYFVIPLLFLLLFVLLYFFCGMGENIFENSTIPFGNFLEMTGLCKWSSAMYDHFSTPMLTVGRPG